MAGFRYGAPKERRSMMEQTQQFYKPRMKINELMNLGFGRDELYRYAHMEGCPVTRTSGNKGHFVFYVNEFMEWIKKKDSIAVQSK